MGPFLHEASPSEYTYPLIQVDGYGNSYLIDDANVPSLLSLPYLGFCSPSDPIYQNTRRFILSTDNPYYFTSSLGPLPGGISLIQRVLRFSQSERYLHLRDRRATHRPRLHLANVNHYSGILVGAKMHGSCSYDLRRDSPAPTTLRSKPAWRC